MNQDLIILASKELNIKPNQIEEVLNLLEKGNTVPFIARYRKEATGALDEDQIRNIAKYYEYQENLLQRKEDIIRLIEQKGMMNEELKSEIIQADKLTQLEELYRPFKEKRKTRATEAKNKGLEPLSKIILSQVNEDLEDIAKKYINEEVQTIKEAIQGALDIIAEDISDNLKYRKFVRDILNKSGIIVTKEKKKHEDENKIYQIYYDYHERVNQIVSHRVLAINRAEKEKVISVKIEADNDFLIKYIYNGITRRKESVMNSYLLEATTDSLNRLILPSIEREIRSELTEKAHIQALKVFSLNLESLLMQAPIKDKIVLGVDPAYRTGCKLAVVDETGKVLEIAKAFFTLDFHDLNKAKKIVLDLINKHKVQIIAIGNGTASRESEAFIAQLIKENNLNIEYAIVSEAGASVYSASKVAQEEFPTYQVEERSAVSIARRLQDPLSELVKIEPQAISVGQYQHDLPSKQLVDQLSFVVEKVVNSVGVDINTASYSLLSYVSGINKTIANNIVEYRNINGKFTDRNQIKDVKKLGSKSFEQAIGFLRIIDGTNPFDKTAIHPEHYQEATKLINSLGYQVSDLGNEDLVIKINHLDQETIQKQLQLDKYTYEDIVDCITKPNRNPRDHYPQPILKQDILKIENLKEGMLLEGTVRNVVDFGVFVDIGLKNDGLVHISQIATKRVKHPLDVVSIGDIIQVKVIDLDIERKRVGLSMIIN